MKLAMISPICKSGSRLKVSNYIPVSALPILSSFWKDCAKQTGRILRQTQNNIWTTIQKNKSTTPATVDIYTKVAKALDTDEFACSVILDVVKVFDTVNHKIFIKKLENYGIRGIANKWLEQITSS